MGKLPNPDMWHGERCLKNVASYLNVSPGVITLNSDKIITRKCQNASYSGLAAVVLSLCDQGMNAEEDCNVYQWLEFLSAFGAGAAILQELNLSLLRTSFISGHRQNVTDVVYYYFLYDTMKNLSPQEKLSLPNLCRWYNLLQRDDQLRKDNDMINFAIIYL